jgi:fatty-acyl-CoA synthase
MSLLALLTGHAVVLMDRFDAGTALRVMAEERVTTTVLTPPMLLEMLDHPDCPAAGFPDLETIYYVGAALPPTRVRAAIDRFGPVLHQMYATTEHGLITELWPIEHDASDTHLLGSAGRPARGVHVELRDADGLVTQSGKVGEVWVRGVMVMEGYWEEPELTRDALRGGWCRTGDLAYRDDIGYLYLVGREKDVIVTGQASGNVYSRLLDDFLCTLPGISQAAAVGVPDDAYVESVHVFLVPENGTQPDLDDVRRQVVVALGELYEPRSFSVLATLPRTPVGKIDKEALRALYLTGGPTRM